MRSCYSSSTPDGIQNLSGSSTGPCVLSLGQTLSTFHYTLLDNCQALLSVIDRGWPNDLDFSLNLELNISLMCCFNN